MRRNFIQQVTICLLFFISFKIVAQSNVFPPNGNVGIGTTSPTALFEVYGSDAKIHGVNIGLGKGGSGYNLCLGYNSMTNNSGLFNTGIGSNTLTNVSGNYNFAMGSYALNALTTGEQNLAIGRH